MPFIDWNLNERGPPYRSPGSGWGMNKGCTGGERSTPILTTLHHSFPMNRYSIRVWDILRLDGTNCSSEERLFFYFSDPLRPLLAKVTELGEV